MKKRVQVLFSQGFIFLITIWFTSSTAVYDSLELVHLNCRQLDG